MTYILFDIGGTKTRVATANELHSLAAVTSFKTPANLSDGVEAIIEAAAKLGAKKVRAAAGGIRGLLLEDKSGIENDGILRAWAGRSLTGALKKVWRAPVWLENDTALGGLGEATFGAGKGVSIVAYHSISTGVGGVKIEDGRIDQASIGFEPGRQVLDIDRTILGSDIEPTLENLVSGTAVEARLGMPPYEIPQSDVLWDDLAGYLAQGLRNTILYWSPDAIVLGGSMMTGEPRISVDAVRKHTVEALDGFVPCPLIALSALKDESGLYGALALLKQNKA
jgi:predicted NBD/HSP70 family sugar kinase